MLNYTSNKIQSSNGFPQRTLLVSFSKAVFTFSTKYLPSESAHLPFDRQIYFHMEGINIFFSVHKVVPAIKKALGGVNKSLNQHDINPLLIKPTGKD